MPIARAVGGKRKLAKVPFVELFDGRLQGVVSSGSDPARVYVSFVEARTGKHGCSTNNNRPCGGGGVCGHIGSLYDNAITAFGAERVARFLGVPEADAATVYNVVKALGGGDAGRDTGAVFARFLDYLRYLELAPVREPLPEMAWFTTG